MARKDKDLFNHLTAVISNWKNDLLLLPQTSAACSERDKLFAYCYELYDNHLVACHVLDFDDLILRPTKLLQRAAALRDRWQNWLRICWWISIRVLTPANMNW